MDEPADGFEIPSELEKNTQELDKRNPDDPRLAAEARAVRENRRRRYLQGLQEDKLDDQE